MTNQSDSVMKRPIMCNIFEKQDIKYDTEKSQNSAPKKCQKVSQKSVGEKKWLKVGANIRDLLHASLMPVISFLK